jgi:hypothetical protein
LTAEPPSAGPDAERSSDARDRRDLVAFALAADFLRASREELAIPRARLRRFLRLAARRLRRFPLLASLAGGVAAGVVFIMYATAAGAGRGLLAWGAFVATGLALAAGGPVLLAHFWPGVVVIGLGVLVWTGASLGPGVVWLAVATAAFALAFYLAADLVVVIGGASVLGWAASGGGAVWTIVAFTGGAVVLFGLRRRLVAPILAAGWSALSFTLASQAAWAAGGEALSRAGDSWPVPGPPGLWLVVLAAAAGAAALTWPRRGTAVLGGAGPA